MEVDQGVYRGKELALDALNLYQVVWGPELGDSQAISASVRWLIKPHMHILKNYDKYGRKKVFLFIIKKALCVCSCSVASNSLQPHGLWPSRLLCPLNLPGNNTGVGCHFLLQGIFLTQGSNLSLFCLLHWQVDSFPLCHLGSPISKFTF